MDDVVTSSTSAPMQNSKDSVIDRNEISDDEISAITNPTYHNDTNTNTALSSAEINAAFDPFDNVKSTTNLTTENTTQFDNFWESDFGSSNNYFQENANDSIKEKSEQKLFHSDIFDAPNIRHKIDLIAEEDEDDLITSHTGTSHFLKSPQKSLNSEKSRSSSISGKKSYKSMSINSISERSRSSSISTSSRLNPHIQKMISDKRRNKSRLNSSSNSAFTPTRSVRSFDEACYLSSSSRDESTILSSKANSSANSKTPQKYVNRNIDYSEKIENFIGQRKSVVIDIDDELSVESDDVHAISQESPPRIVRNAKSDIGDIPTHQRQKLLRNFLKSSKPKEKPDQAVLLSNHYNRQQQSINVGYTSEDFYHGGVVFEDAIGDFD